MESIDDDNCKEDGVEVEALGAIEAVVEGGVDEEDDESDAEEEAYDEEEEEEEYKDLSEVEGFLWAARTNNKKKLTHYLENGLDVNAQDEQGNTALHMACANGYVGIVDELLASYKAQILQNSFGNTPLHWAVQNSQTNVLKYIVKFRFHELNVPSTLLVASATSELPTKTLKESQNASNSNSESSFTTPNSSNNALYIKNNTGKTPLGEAFGTNNMKLIQLLLDAASSSSS